VCVCGGGGIACAGTTGGRRRWRWRHEVDARPPTVLKHAVCGGGASSGGTTERGKGRAGGEAVVESERGGDDRRQGGGERG
jgi:hypothetical protein